MVDNGKSWNFSLEFILKQPFDGTICNLIKVFFKVFIE